MKKLITLLLFASAAFSIKATDATISGLNSKQFNKFWKIESESPEYKVSFKGDTAEILSPKGLTLWRKEKMSGNVTVEYDACVVVEPGNENDRLSDLNCFWMASDTKNPKNIFAREDWRKGIFLNCYSLQLYYMGFGGNYNTTTRFRRYDGNEEGITDSEKRPAILKEYTDKENLLEANRWYKIKISNSGGKIQYYIDGKRLVDFRDPNPLTEGWFGFRTTLSRTRITNFRYSEEDKNENVVPLNWIGETPQTDKPVSFGIPFDQGEIKIDTPVALFTNNGENVSVDCWPMAFWPDGSIKWGAVSGVIPAGTESLKFHTKNVKKDKESATFNQKKSFDGTPKKSDKKLKSIAVTETGKNLIINTGEITAYLSKTGKSIIDSLYHNDIKCGDAAYLICSTQNAPAIEGVNSISYKNYESVVTDVEIESSESSSISNRTERIKKSGEINEYGKKRVTVRIKGIHTDETDSRRWMPFDIRLYFYAGSSQINMVHNFVYDGDQNEDFIRSIGIRFEVPMREQLYNRHIAFACADGGVWSEPVKPLIGRRVLKLNDDNTIQQQQMDGKRVAEYSEFDDYNRNLIDNWASWDSYRLSQLSADAFSIRKRANDNNPWIGTFSGTRSEGYAFAGDISGGIAVCLHDFWQSYPSSIQIDGARTDNAIMTTWLWSPESEPMDLRHYDNVAHDLNASYEDVQEGMSTPYGIARTHSLTIDVSGGYKGKEDFAKNASTVTNNSRLMPTPEYLYSKRAFGVWSLPDRSTEFREKVEERLDTYIDFYHNAIEQNKWYGFWNYGDVMHAYDPVRHEWRYDVGGYAWDNTELASNMWLWYYFLRSGDINAWKMAEAMSRHTAEVDVYHIGENAGLGSRHNVSHWGCGAKEARISQAAWNRFYYYLTTDERCGDLMNEVKDAEQKLYTLDPMRLAQPREKFPCTAPARLRIGPDWVSYAGNWMTEWERTGNTIYRDKIIAGMKSICALPNGIFSGPQALGFNPETCEISYEGDPQMQNTNHLLAIMGGFEVMNEMMTMIDLPEWNNVWLNHAADYKEKALKVGRNRFRVSRLAAYAAYHLMDEDRKQDAWIDLMTKLEHTAAPPFKIEKVMPPYVPAPKDECATISTNDAALWSLDAIYMMEVIPIDMLKY